MTSPDAASGVYEQSVALSPGGKVHVQQPQGRLRVTGWDRPEVQVKARGTDAGHNLRVHSQGNRCTIEVRHSRGIFGGLLAPVMDLELKVPADAGLDLETGATDVTIAGVHGAAQIDAGSGSIRCTDMGPVNLDCGSGNVTIDQADGRVRVDSGSGTVRVTGIRGDVHLDGSSGDLHLEQVRGAVQADTGSGSIVLRSVTGDSARLDTGSGDVQITDLQARLLDVDTGSGSVTVSLVDVDPQGTYSIETGSGDVAVQVPANARLAVRIEARSRQIDNSLSLSNVQVDDDEMRGLIGGGGNATLHIEAHGRVRLAAYTGWAPETPAASQPPVPPAPPKPPAPPAAPAEAMLRVQSESAADPGDDEYRRVLKMVEEGKLKPEEADAILRALEEGTGEEQP